MSETIASITAFIKRNAKAVAAVVVFAVLLLAYGAGLIFMPVSILLQYREKKCETVLSLNGFYKGMYPAAFRDKTLAPPVQECAIYILATQLEEQEKWSDAYEAYQVYSGAFPGGLFANESHEHSAGILVEISKTQIEAKEYNKALETLERVAAEYSDTLAVTDDSMLTGQLYRSWAGEQLSAGDFQGSIQTLSDYKSWIQSNNQPELEADAQRMLAESYLEWGLSLQAEKQFDAAKLKLDLAASTDPEPASPSGPAAQVKANEPKLQVEWGDDLLAQKDYSGAIARYELAIAAGQERSALQGAMANAQIQWAFGLSENEDFLGALQKLNLVEEQFATDSIKASVEEARQKIYLAFSNSSGAQAKQAMKDAADIICRLGKTPDLPIFGLDKGKVLAVVYGIDEQLPKNVAATTPGQMHYVVCVDEILSETIEYVNYYGIEMYRIRTSWKISLRRSATGEFVKDGIIPGRDPAPLPTTGAEIYYGGRLQRNYGVPDIADLANWLLPYLK